MRSLAFAIVLVACTPDVDQYPIVANTSPPALGQAHEAPPTVGPDATPTDAAVADTGRPDAFRRPDAGPRDAGPISRDAGGMPSDAGVPPIP
jgi:hypothetical protein